MLDSTRGNSIAPVERLSDHMMAHDMETNVASEVKPIDTASCTECGRVFAADDLIHHETSRICINCKPVFLQKLAEGVEIRTSMYYAGFWLRFIAAFLDGLLLFAVNFALGLGTGYSVRQVAGMQSAGLGFGLLLWVIQMTVYVSYETVMIGKYGATLGKMACKIRVVTGDGRKVSYGRAAARYLSKFLSTFTLLIGYIVAAFDSQKRALHDRICDTRVVFD